MNKFINHILVVDDDNEIRSLVKQYLDQNNFLVTTATSGDSADFGDLTAGRDNFVGTSNGTRGCFSGGRTPSYINTIDYITIASTGNAADFADLTAVSNAGSGESNGHGGLS